MKILKKLLNLLVKTERPAPSAPQSTTTASPPMFEDNARISHAGLSPVRTNGNGHHLGGTTRNNIGRAVSVRHAVRASRNHTDTRNAEELLRDGHLQIALAGFNRSSFILEACTRSDDAGLAREIADLPTQVKMVPHRDIAGGLRVALQMLSRSPQGRTGIVILTSGEPTMNSSLARELAQTAVKWRTAVHVIQIGHEESGRPVLAGLATRSALGYGQFRQVRTQDDLLEAIRAALDGLAPVRGMAGINSVVVLTDLSEKMVESFQETTRIEMVAAALQEYLRNPLVRATEKRLALAA